MRTIDEGVETGLSLSITCGEMTGQLLIACMERFIDLIKKDPSKKSSFYQNNQTEKGKLKLKKLFEKHSKGEILSLNDNLSKEEYRAIQNELKKMGADFSITKNGKDDYSLFFAGKDVASIEKGMENAIKKYSKKQEKKKKPFNTNKLRINQKHIDLAKPKEQEKLEYKKQKR